MKDSTLSALNRLAKALRDDDEIDLDDFDEFLHFRSFLKNKYNLTSSIGPGPIGLDLRK